MVNIACPNSFSFFHTMFEVNDSMAMKNKHASGEDEIAIRILQSLPPKRSE